MNKILSNRNKILSSPSAFRPIRLFNKKLPTKSQKLKIQFLNYFNVTQRGFLDIPVLSVIKSSSNK